MTSLRPVLAAVLAASVVGAGAAVAAPAKPAKVRLGPNLVVNASFEQSTAEQATANGIPVLPVGWTVEGATVLFDYNARGGKTGGRNAAISGSLAPGAQVCDASSGSYVCAPNPGHPATSQVNEQAMSRSSVRPFWVTQAAIPVQAGKSYRFTMWSIRPSLDPNAGVLGEGAAAKVRWIGADGGVVKVVDGPKQVKTAKRDLGFKMSFADVVAPAGAVGAKLLLGHTDYTVTSAQVAFDDIAFQLKR